ncbi:MAG: glycosyltransferase family 4 protein [Planctomycetota bacterium]
MPRILYISNSLPVPPTNGGKQRTNLLIRSLQRIADVDVIGITASKVPKGEVEELRTDFGLIDLIKPSIHSDLQPWRTVRPLAPKLVQRLAHNLGNRKLDYRTSPRINEAILKLTNDRAYDLAVGRYLLATTQSGVIDRIPTILDVDDLDTQVYATRLNAPGESKFERWVVKRHLTQLEEIIPLRLAKIKHLWMASAKDLPLVSSHPEVSVLPNIPFAFADRVPKAQPPAQGGRLAIIVGSMNHPPNFRGVDRLVELVWPKVRQACPDALLRIIGTKTSDDQKRRWGASPGVEVAGFVPDLSDAYREASFTVCPIYEGGGTKIKVLESLAYNRACVTTEHSLHGYEHVLKDKESLRVVRTDEEMVQAVLELFEQPSFAATMAEHGRKLVMDHFSFNRFAGVVQETVEKVLSKKDSSGLRAGE